MKMMFHGYVCKNYYLFHFVRCGTTSGVDILVAYVLANLDSLLGSTPIEDEHMRFLGVIDVKTIDRTSVDGKACDQVGTNDAFSVPPPVRAAKCINPPLEEISRTLANVIGGASASPQSGNQLHHTMHAR